MSERRSKRRSTGRAREGSQTDFDYLNRISDEEIATAVAQDSDAAPLDIDWSKAELVIPPGKKPISIRVDADVLDFFKKQGAGYQRRINAVLRSYMQSRRKKRA
jgi:uncharacterized protein (DUF4415 family)